MKAHSALLYIGCLAFSLLMAAGQLMFKMAALQQEPGAFAPTRLLSSPWFLGAVGLYGVTTVFWVYILVRLPLSTAYPFTLLAAALVPIAAHFLFAEPLVWKFWIGFVLVLAGLYVIHGA